ncbi:MAG: YceI family protein [Romboutsia sp.]|nr:YceI family protein [Romboutsia sp.]
MNSMDLEKKIQLNSILDEYIKENALNISDNNYKITNGKSSYTVTKKFFDKPHEKVTGTTTEVIGIGSYDDNNLTLVVMLNPKTFTTGLEKRDQEMDKFFKSEAIFTINDLQLNKAEGEDLRIDQKITGKVLVNGLEKNIDFQVTGLLTDNSVTAEGIAEAKISDFGITPPNLLNVYTMDDAVTLNFEINAIKSQ